MNIINQNLTQNQSRYNQINFKAFYIKPKTHWDNESYLKLKGFVDVLTDGNANERTSLPTMLKNEIGHRFHKYIGILEKQKGLDCFSRARQDIFYSDKDFKILKKAEEKIQKAKMGSGGIDNQKVQKAATNYFKKAFKIARDAVEISPKQLDASIKKFEQAKADSISDMKLT